MLTSRSAVLTYQVCPRKRYLNYHVNQTGITSSFLNLDLAIGSCCHRGLQHLLEHCRVHHPDGDFEEKCIDEAVEHALNMWMNDFCSNCNFKARGLEDFTYVMYESANLIEGLIRSWAIYRLPLFLEQYEVLEVEKEEIFPFNKDVIFQAKADGLLRNRSNNELVILSIKTAAQFLPITMTQILYDMQGMSEIACVKNRLNNITSEILDDTLNKKYLKFAKELNITQELYNYLSNNLQKGGDNSIKIKMVQYEYLLKGQYRQESDGLYKRQSFLVHPLKQDTFMIIGSGGFKTTPDSFKWKTGSGRPPKGWSKCDIWEEISMKEWINLLASNLVQPEEGIAFSSLFPNSEETLVIRSEEEIKEWEISTKYQEQSIFEKLNLMKIMNNPEEGLAMFFPKNTQNCTNFYGGSCQFIPLCHEGMEIDTAISNGLYFIRKPHHELEMSSFKEKGWIENESTINNKNS